MGVSKSGDQKALTVRSGAIALGFLLSVPGAIGGALALAPLWAVVGVLAAPWRALPELARRGGLGLGVFVAFFLWAQISMLWAPHYDARTSSHMAGGFLTGLLLIAAFVWRPEARDSGMIRTAAIGFALFAAILGAIEIFGRAPITRLFQPHAQIELLMRAPMKGVSVLVVTAWAIAGLMWRRGGLARWGAALLVLAVLILAINSNMDANVAAMILGGVGFLAGNFFGHRAFRVVGLAVAAFILLAPAIFALALPALAQTHMPASWTMRVAIWSETLSYIAAHPWFGSGFSSFRDVALSFDFAGSTITAQHTHNAALQIWFETGLVGAALAAGALGLLAWNGAKALRGDAAGSAAATGTIAALAPIAFLSWALWQEWWVATMFLAGAIAAAAHAPISPGAASAPGSPAPAAD